MGEVAGQTNQGFVTAAVDGSDATEAVVAWASDEAMRRGVPLHLRSVVEVAREFAAPDLIALGPDVDRSLGASARGLVARAAAAATDRHPNLVVDAATPFGRPAAVLVADSEDASVLVVGATTRGAAERLLIGSVANTVIEHAACPVVVVPAGYEVGPIHRIVVGVDGELSRDAVAFALEEAALTGAGVACLTLWMLAVVDGMVVTEPGSPKWQAVVEGHRARTSAVLEPLLAERPGVTAEIVVERANPTKGLIDAGAKADLLVLGTRGRGGFRGLLLGSVSKRVLERATGPVAVVR